MGVKYFSDTQRPGPISDGIAQVSFPAGGDDNNN